MTRTIKSFRDGSALEYDRGSFDDWCVYLKQADGTRKPPRDTEYFQQLLDFAKEYGRQTIYDDFVTVYELTGKEVSGQVLQRISEIAAAYGHDADELDRIFTILYMAMIAEEQKRSTRLGKRIKRLGVHAVLMEDKPVSEAANFMRGMGWREIDRLCAARGF